jgi:ABC-type uncharacterized transport system ATPase subunit
MERLGSELVLSGTKTKTPQSATPEELSIEQKKRLREEEKTPAVKEVKETRPAETAIEKAPEKPADRVTEIVPDIVDEKPQARIDQLDTVFVMNMVEKLAKGMSSISSELAAIRRLMEDDRKRAAGR